MLIAATGFVSEHAGSVASANALLLGSFLNEGGEITFFSKASFVDPRPAVGKRPGFSFVDVDNTGPDRFRHQVERIPLLGAGAQRLDAWTYNRKLVTEMGGAHRGQPFSLALWMGDFARGRVPGLPGVSFAQGAPGSDARSIVDRRAVIQAVAGPVVYWKWRLLAALRLSAMGLPPLRLSDHVIVGSSVSREILINRYGIAPDRVSTLPYPIDLELFRLDPFAPSGRPPSGPLRVLWLGRIVPRKRLELFLDGAARAIARGVDLAISVVGQVGFIPGYEKLIRDFPHPDRLTWIRSVARGEVPALFYRHDVLAQPSDEENFGSSVAEAQACGLPVIVGQTNGNADYLCERDLHLGDDHPETFAVALAEMARRRQSSALGDPRVSRVCAERHFSLATVTTGLLSILNKSALPVHGRG